MRGGPKELLDGRRKKRGIYRRTCLERWIFWVDRGCRILYFRLHCRDGVVYKQNYSLGLDGFFLQVYIQATLLIRLSKAHNKMLPEENTKATTLTS